MSEILHYTTPPKEIKSEIKELFSSYPFKDFQLNSLGVTKEEMSEYLWSTICNNADSLFLAVAEEGEISGFIYASPNNFVSGHLEISSWSIRHLLFRDNVEIKDRKRLLNTTLSLLKEKNVEFLDTRTAPEDKTNLSLLQLSGFDTVGVTSNCLLKPLAEIPEKPEGFQISHAQKSDEDEIHSLVRTNHRHNHYYYDTRFSREKVEKLYGNLVSKTIDMKNTKTLTARDGDGVLRGVVTYKTAPRISCFTRKKLGSLDFIAVDKRCRQHGLGDYLNRMALHEMGRKSIEGVIVRTMFNNYNALAALGKLNMKITSSDIILHKWL